MSPSDVAFCWIVRITATMLEIEAPGKIRWSSVTK